ncbi:transposase [Alkaliphilus pronyensis]|uniref:Transposase n=1 Tax=Alkaliphilus pronyensis TaxID=1482732 RepID=A0A6I0F963_9FIRM|nr:transposase [Alkaliphilus pronyensis]KAB3538635.1 transposase [Alkaliphilus pronyensis]
MTKNKNNHYTKEFKESILQRIESSNVSIQSIAEEIGIPRTTIYQYVNSKVKKEKQHVTATTSKHPSKWTSEDKFV